MSIRKILISATCVLALVGTANAGAREGGKHVGDVERKEGGGVSRPGNGEGGTVGDGPGGGGDVDSGGDTGTDGGGDTGGVSPETKPDTKKDPKPKKPKDRKRPDAPRTQGFPRSHDTGNAQNCVPWTMRQDADYTRCCLTGNKLKVSPFTPSAIADCKADADWLKTRR